MSNQVNAWSLLVQGDAEAALAIVERMPTCVHVNGWAYVGGKRKGFVAHPQTAAENESTYSSYSIGSTGAVAAPLLFYAIALRQAAVVSHLLRLGSCATLSIKGGVTPLGIAKYFADKERGSDHEGSLTLPSKGANSKPADEILALVERYVERASDPLRAAEEDEMEERSVIEAEEEHVRNEIILKRNTGMVRLVCEIRDEVGGYTVDGTKTNQMQSLDISTSINAQGREEYTFLFPRYGSYHSLRARLETLLGCRVGIAFDKSSMDRLQAAYSQVVGEGSKTEGFSGNLSHTLNTTMNSTSSALQHRPNTTSTTIASLSRASTPQSQMTLELNPSNFKQFITQAELLIVLHSHEASAKIANAAVSEAEENNSSVSTEITFIPTLRCIVRPVPYAAAGNEADASHYAQHKNKTRIAKDLKEYEKLPANERDLSRVQALKKQVDDEEREFLTKQNYFQFQAKKLSPDAIEAATKRLYEYPMTKLRERYEAFDGEVEEQMEKLIRSRRPGELSAEQQESVDRLHNGASEREERLAQMDEDHWATIPQPPTSSLDEDEAAACRERLTTDTRAAARAKLDKTIYGEQEEKWKRKLTKEEMDRSVHACYEAPKERHAKTMATLEAKYGDWMLRKKQFKAQPIKKYGKK